MYECATRLVGVYKNNDRSGTVALSPQEVCEGINSKNMTVDQIIRSKVASGSMGA